MVAKCTHDSVGHVCGFAELQQSQAHLHAEVTSLKAAVQVLLADRYQPPSIDPATPSNVDNTPLMAPLRPTEPDMTPHPLSTQQQQQGRRLAGPSGQAAIQIEQPGASIQFVHEGTSIHASGPNQLVVDGSLTVVDDLAVRGKLLTDGTFLNLGVPLTADTPVKAGTLVSLVPGGGVAAGFGLHMSSELAALPSAHHLSIISVGDNTTVTLTQTRAGMVSAVYFDTQASAAEPPIAVGGGMPLRQVSAAGLEPIRTGGVVKRRMLVCYVVASGAEHGECSMGEWQTGADLVMGSGLEIRAGTRYMGGVVAGIGGSSDRAVLVYNVEQTPGVPSSARMEAQLLMLQAGNVIAVGSAVPLVAGVTTHHALATLSPLKLLLAYRSDSLKVGHTRELYFVSGSLNQLNSRQVFDFSPVYADPTYINIARLSDTSAIVAYRLASDLYRVYARSIDTTTALMSMGEPVLVDSGTTVPSSRVSYDIGIAAGSSTRFLLAFADATGRAIVRDGGLYGTSISLGSTAPAHTDPDSVVVSASLASVGVGSMRVACAVQAEGTGSGLIRVGRLYGGPTVLGFAKSDAATGESVYVVLDGGVSGFTGLAAGAAYYGRSDGSVSIDGSQGGMIVGQAMSSTVLKSLVGADGPTNAGLIRELSREVEAGKLRELTVAVRISALESALDDRAQELHGRIGDVIADQMALNASLANAWSNVTALETFSGQGVRVWSGFDTSSMRAGGWQRYRYAATLQDTTQGEITMGTNDITINQAGWYELSFSYREEWCYAREMQLYISGVLEVTAYMDDSYSDDQYSFHQLHRVLKLKAGDTVWIQMYGHNCHGSYYYLWVGGTQYNRFQLRTLALQ